jgi:hypothetical protein
MSDAALDGKIFPATWIFYAKNYFGMVDKQEVSVTASNQLAPSLDLDQIAEKVKSDIPPIDTDYRDVE